MASSKSSSLLDGWKAIKRQRRRFPVLCPAHKYIETRTTTTKVLGIGPVCLIVPAIVVL